MKICGYAPLHVGPSTACARRPMLAERVATIHRARMDKIFLSALRVECVVGIWEWERRIKQTVVLDVEMATDIRRAAASDHIDDTLDYKKVAKRLIGFVGD